jgi:hypothetical protein
MNTLNKRNYTDSDFPSPKKQKEVPWLKWTEAQDALKNLTAVRIFLNSHQSHELYLDNPQGKSFRFIFEPAKSFMGLQIEECVEQENKERPLVDLSISDAKLVTIRWIEASNPTLFECAWKITQLTLQLWQISTVEAIDVALTDEEIPRQLLHAFQGQCYFQTIGLEASPKVKEAQDFLSKLTIGDLKGILNGFSRSIAKVTRLQNKYNLEEATSAGRLIRQLAQDELKTLRQECLTPWTSKSEKEDSPLLKPYLKSLQTLYEPTHYVTPSKGDRPFNERLELFLSQHQMGIAGKEHISLLFKSKTEKEFHSEGLSDRLLRESKRSPNPHHIYLTVEEKIGNQLTTILKITFSPHGLNAELCWIQKGKELSGDYVFGIFNRIDEALRPENIYLFDDAKVSIGEIRDEEHLVSLKVLNCLVKRDANLSSWYEKYGFQICHFPHFKPLVRKDLWPTYRYLLPEFLRAKAFIRNTKADFLIKSTLKFLPEEQKTLLDLGNKYLKRKDFTIHEIFAAIYEKAPKSEDLFTLYSICFKDFEEDKDKVKAFGTAAKNYTTFADHFDFFTLNPILVRTRTNPHRTDV